MNGRIGRIHKLTGNKAVRDLLRQLVGFGDGALHALGAFGEDKLRAVGFHQLAALYAHGLRHDDDDAVAAGGSHGSKADARVAGGRLDDHRAALEQAFLLRVVDHRFGNAILYAAGGVKILELAQHAGLKALGFFNMYQLQQRGLADQLVRGCINLTHGSFLLMILCCWIFRYASAPGNIGGTYGSSSQYQPFL